MESVAQQKNDIRMHARRHRAHIKVHKDDSDRVFEQLKSHIKQGDVVALYWAIGDELDTAPIFQHLQAMNVQCALPVISADEKVMSFAAWDMDTPLVAGAHNIPVPKTPVHIVPDIIIVPMLAFDQKGYRIGYGGGYYDATLADLRAHGDVAAIGIAYGEQACVFKLPRESHDEPLDVIITPTQVYSFSKTV